MHMNFIVVVAHSAWMNLNQFLLVVCFINRLLLLTYSLFIACPSACSRFSIIFSVIFTLAPRPTTTYTHKKSWASKRPKVNKHLFVGARYCCGRYFSIPQVACSFWKGSQIELLMKYKTKKWNGLIVNRVCRAVYFFFRFVFYFPPLIFNSFKSNR